MCIFTLEYTITLNNDYSVVALLAVTFSFEKLIHYKALIPGPAQQPKRPQKPAVAQTHISQI